MMGQLNRRILLVDDEPLIRKVITGHLVAAGFVVRTAVDGFDALEKLRGGVPDLIISDLKLPRMSGIELLHIVRRRFPQIPVIAISSEPVRHEIPEGLEADAFFQKSGQGFEGLLQSIHKLIKDPTGRQPAPLPDNRPVRARWDGNGNYCMGCEDCLRTFSVPRARFVGRRDLWTTCVHCGHTVQFAIGSPGMLG